MSGKTIGHISKVSFGMGGYQSAMFGIGFTLSHDGCLVVGDFWGTWSTNVEVTERTKWTEEDRSKTFDETMRRIDKLMQEAKVKHIEDLVGKPIYVISEKNTLKSWGILTEAIL